MSIRFSISIAALSVFSNGSLTLEGGVSDPKPKPPKSLKFTGRPLPPLVCDRGVMRVFKDVTSDEVNADVWNEIHLTKVHFEHGPDIADGDRWSTTSLESSKLISQILSSTGWSLYEMSSSCSERISFEVPFHDCTLALKMGGHFSRDPLGVGSFGTVFAVDKTGAACPTGEVVVKYGNNCEPRTVDAKSRYSSDKLPSADLLVMEYVVMALMGPLGVSPKVYALSAPGVPLGGWKLDKRLATMDEGFGNCADQHAMVRGMVMDRIHSDLEEYVEKVKEPVQNFLSALKGAKGTVEKLRILHEYGFIHGDIHAGNVALKTSDGFEITLIDFGLARFFPAEIGAPEEGLAKIDPAIDLSHLSPWQLGGSRIGRRDDVYRAIEMVVRVILKGDVYKEFLYHHAGEAAAMARFKMTKKLFEGAEKNVCELMSMESIHCHSAMAELDAAIDTVRKTASVDDEPDYETIINHLQLAITALEQN
jgi:hypothetical protein